MKRSGLQPSLALGFNHSIDLGKGLALMALALSSLLAGCGQKGPLYLPTPPAAPAPHPAASAAQPPSQP